MKVFLVFVMTTDGKVTRWGDPNVRSWSSHEDQEYFIPLITNSPLVVLGSNTYRADPMKPKEKRLMIVLTRNPEHYKELEEPGKLEFTNESPMELVEKYRKMGFKQMMVAGGPKIAASFLKEKLVDEIWLTVEPLVFGTGGNFVNDIQLDIRMKLISAEKLNEQGTLILKYAVERFEV